MNAKYKGISMYKRKHFIKYKLKYLCKVILYAHTSHNHVIILHSWNSI